MNTFGRLITALGVALAALATLAGVSSGAVNPKLMVTSSTSGGTLSIWSGELNAANDPLGEVEIYVPAGYGFSAPSGPIGKARVTDIFVQQDPGTPLAMSGSVTAVSPSDARVSTSATGCDPTGHLASWLVSVSGGTSDSFSFPLFVDQTSGSETQFGQYKLVACPPPVAQGNQLVSMALTLSGFTAPQTPGSYVWRSLLTPFAPSSATLDAGAAVEAQSTETLEPASLTLSGHMLPSATSRKRVTLSGRLLVGGKPAQNVIVAIEHGASAAGLVRLGTARTTASGTWSKTVTEIGPSYFEAGATLAGQPGACQASFGVPCLSASGGSTTVATSILHLGAS